MIRALVLVTLAACKGFFNPMPPDGPPDAPRSTIAYVQSGFVTGTSTLALNAVYPLPQHAGDLDLVVVEWAAGPQLQEIHDGEANSYVPAIAPQGANGIQQAIFIAPAIVGVVGGANSVQVTFTTPANFAELRIVEYAGLDPATPLDGTSIGTGASDASGTSGPINTTHAHDLLVASATATTRVSGPSADYTSRVVTNAGNLVEDREVFATGTYDAALNFTGASAWEIQLVALRAAD
jgi:hypothetical protein